MKQRVCTIGRYEDIIKDNYEELKEILIKKYHLLRRGPERPWEILKFDWDTVQLLWFVSADYSAFIKDAKFWAAFPVKYVFELYGNDLTNIDQLAKLKKALKLEDNQVYFRLTDVVVGEKERCETIFSGLASLGITRVRIDFAEPNKFDMGVAAFGATLSAMASKYKLDIGSNNHATFSDNNKWLKNDPAISGQLMHDILGLRMVRQPDTYNRPNEYSHKCVELLGIGQRYNGEKLNPSVLKEME